MAPDFEEQHLPALCAKHMPEPVRIRGVAVLPAVTPTPIASVKILGEGASLGEFKASVGLSAKGELFDDLFCRPSSLDEALTAEPGKRTPAQVNRRRCCPFYLHSCMSTFRSDRPQFCPARTFMIVAIIKSKSVCRFRETGTENTFPALQCSIAEECSVFLFR